ncbi:MAG: protein O-mannosyl-transferase family [Paludibacteraceae bacterium]
MKKFRLLNNVFGWVTFAIAAVTYLMTIEPTASFWDCGEFISTIYKFDVGHPPGAPFFMLTAKFFTLFTSDPGKVASMVNSFSALASGFTILFLFWTITHLAQKVIGKREEEYTVANIITILGAGMVGALAYTFSDTFWFSAVEGEVYAYSSFFTAIVFWLILKWEKNADNPGSDRWLILIAYLMGLSIGVHLLNLLAIPAIVLVYYYKKFIPSWKGFVLALIASVAILGFTQYGVIPGFTTVASKFELFFVNTLRMPYNSGMFIYLILMISALIWAIFESHTNKSYRRMTVSYVLAITLVGVPFVGENLVIGIIVLTILIGFFYYKKKSVSARWLNTSILMITMMLVGYSSYAVIMIRSAAQPTMDQNSPDNVFALKYYLNREQYGDRPLLYGATFNAPMKLKVQGNSCTYDADKSPLYAPKPKRNPSEKDEYIVAGYKFDYKKDDKFMMLFPRMYSSEPNHVKAYKMWGNVTGNKIDYDFCGEKRSEIKPTFGENLRYFFDYQVNFMYWRYFMWNFSGRQNDMQGYGEIEHGNWITGIGFIDNMLVGNQKLLPKELKENKGRNTYFLLPLLLGLLGIFYLLNSGKKGNQVFWIVMLLFFMTGLAIVIYLNQTPYQPRERDYAYAGSFYAFTIWIGLGVIGLVKLLDNILPKKVNAVLVPLACLGIPVLMAAQNWDDHDRSGRYTARDFGQNYLNSTEKNAILFSNGDNDTFPLWYNQEVEGVRTDVRVCNLSYLPTDWYIDQMKRGAYKSAPLPISWEKKDYISGRNDVMSVQNLTDGKPFNMKDAFEIIKSDDPQFKIEGDGFFPSPKLSLPVNATEAFKTGTIPAKYKDKIVPEMIFDLPHNVFKGESMVMEMLKENQWKRPMYICVTVGEEFFPSSLNKYLSRTGLAYQILPVGQQDSTRVNVNTDEMYENMMTKFRFGGIENPKVYIDDNIMRMCKTHRIQFTYLIEALIAEGDTVRAKKVVEYANKVIPATTVPHDYSSNMMALYCYQLGMKTQGDAILNAVAQNSVDYLTWYASLKPSQQSNASNSIGQEMAVINQILQISNQVGAKNIFNKYVKQFESFAARFNMHN